MSIPHSLIAVLGSKLTSDATEQQPTSLSFIRLTGGPSFSATETEQEYTDMIDANNEDPFCLDSFESLCRLHAEKRKDFIIARVKTADPQDEKRFYYSYYAAHHINKLLFRTQPELGLLHRMKAKNPLNNMCIVGDVHYFAIKAAQLKRIVGQDTIDKRTRKRSDSDRKHVHIYAVPSITFESATTKETVPLSSKEIPHPIITSPKLLSSLTNALLSPTITNTKSSRPYHSASPRMNKYRIKNDCFANDSPTFKTTADWVQHKIASSPAVGQTKNEIPIIYEAVYYASDDDFLVSTNVRSYFKENALDADDSILFTIPAATDRLVLDDFEQHPALPGFAYAVDENGRYRNPLVRFLKSKYMKWFLAVYIIAGILFTKFIIPQAYAYVFTFLMVFLFCLLMKDARNSFDNQSHVSDISKNNAMRESIEKFLVPLLAYRRYQTRWESVKQYRFVLRTIQLLLAIGAFISYLFATFSVNYSSNIIHASGINIMVMTSITSIVLSLCTAFIYWNPAFLAIPPHREQRASRVEMGMDTSFCILWTVTASVLAYFGKCPRALFDHIQGDCLSWNMCMSLGYIVAACYGLSIYRDIDDLRNYGWNAAGKRRDLVENGIWRAQLNAWKNRNIL